MLLYTGGSVDVIVVMYSINVFLTFTLSQLGMCVHWWQVRHDGAARGAGGSRSTGSASSSRSTILIVTVR